MRLTDGERRAERECSGLRSGVQSESDLLLDVERHVAQRDGVARDGEHFVPAVKRLAGLRDMDVLLADEYRLQAAVVMHGAGEAIGIRRRARRERLRRRDPTRLSS